MAEEKQYTTQQAHQKFAVELFNGTWDLIEKPNRTPEESEKMIHMAHASCYHWTEVGKPLNRARGEWQISRVYSLLARAEPAYHHAQQCLALTEANGFGGFDLAFAHEAMARASALCGRRDDYEKHYALALKAGEEIKEQGDRDYFFKDLQGGPWSGMR
jgi:hypothetical protein